MISFVLRKIAFMSVLSALIAGCAGSGAVLEPVALDDIEELSRSISALGPNVDPNEAERAADIAYRYAHQLAGEYNVTDSPLIHNTKVNLNLRPRGLCYHWADDIEAGLAQEGFKTLDLHRAIANASSIRIEHSSVIISKKGGSMFDGIVLDGWRHGGALFWSPMQFDARYEWRPRAEVFAQRRKRKQAR